MRIAYTPVTSLLLATITLAPCARAGSQIWPGCQTIQANATGTNLYPVALNYFAVEHRGDQFYFEHVPGTDDVYHLYDSGGQFMASDPDGLVRRQAQRGNETQWKVEFWGVGQSIRSVLWNRYLQAQPGGVIVRTNETRDGSGSSWETFRLSAGSGCAAPPNQEPGANTTALTEYFSGRTPAIEAEANLKVVGEANDGQFALEQIRKLKPDVLVLDISMPVLDGFMLAEQIRQAGLAVKLIFLSVHREAEFFDRALDVGAGGYILKDSALNEIVVAIREVASGRYYASPGVTAHLLDRRKRARDLRRDKPGVKDLTPAERSVLRLIADYKASSEIGEQLHISPRTVDTHRNNICSKLDLRGKHALAKFAIENRRELE